MLNDNISTCLKKFNRQIRIDNCQYEINWTLIGAIISPDSILTTGDCCVANGLNNPNGDTMGVAGHLRFERSRSDGTFTCGNIIDFNYEQELFLYKLTVQAFDVKCST